MNEKAALIPAADAYISALAPAGGAPTASK